MASAPRHNLGLYIVQEVSQISPNMDHHQGISFLFILFVGSALAASIESPRYTANGYSGCYKVFNLVDGLSKHVVIVERLYSSTHVDLPEDGVVVEDADHEVGEMELRRYLEQMRPSKGVAREKRQAPEAEVATSADKGSGEAPSPTAAPPAGPMSTTATALTAAAPAGPQMTTATALTAERVPGNGTSRCGFGGAGFFPGFFPGVGFPGVGVGVQGGAGVQGAAGVQGVVDGGAGIPGAAGGVTVNGVPARMGFNRPVMPMSMGMGGVSMGGMPMGGMPMGGMPMGGMPMGGMPMGGMQMGGMGMPMMMPLMG